MDEQLPLKQMYQGISAHAPLSSRLLDPKRYVVNKAPASAYANGMCGFVSDFISTQGLLKSITEVDDGKIPLVESNRDNRLLWSALYAQELRIQAKCPTYFLAPDIGEALIQTEPPADFAINEIKWPYPSFRVFLPLNWFFYDKMPLMFIDITYLPTGEALRPNATVINEVVKLSNMMGTSMRVPNATPREAPSGIHLGCAPDNEFYGAQKVQLNWPLKGSTLGEMLETRNGSSDYYEAERVKVVTLAMNIVMLLSYAPNEISEELLLRKAKVNGRGEILKSELWEPRFIGRPQFTSPKPSNVQSAPNGQVHFDEVRKGHWKRQPHGPGRSERKVIWISLYRTRSQEERGLKPDD